MKITIQWPAPKAMEAEIVVTRIRPAKLHLSWSPPLRASEYHYAACGSASRMVPAIDLEIEALEECPECAAFVPGGSIRKLAEEAAA